MGVVVIQSSTSLFRDLESHREAMLDRCTPADGSEAQTRVVCTYTEGDF
jgi:hypothetical protein